MQGLVVNITKYNYEYIQYVDSTCITFHLLYADFNFKKCGGKVWYMHSCH